ncbi:MAG: hypothetical protein M3R36_16345 [Bacteroidota bacterium]|nr:hypothetical protein [Bacteroidota bacterium]
MLSVKGIYNGKNITLLERIIVDSPKEVIITFLEPEINYWSKEEVEKMGLTTLTLTDFDNEDYSKW